MSSPPETPSPSDAPSPARPPREAAPPSQATPRPGPVGAPAPRKPLRRAKTPFRWLRRVLLIVGLLGVAALGVLLAAYRFGTQTGPDAVEEEQPLPEDDAVTVSYNVDFVQTSGGQKVFRVIADRQVQRRTGEQHLEGVTLEVDREDGSQLVISSDRATLADENERALLEGNVSITGWGDLRLESRAIEVRDRGNTMLSPGTVELFFPPDLVGRASSMRIDKASNMVTLDGGVHLHTLPGVEVPIRLDTKRLVYRRSEGLIRAVEDVYLRRGGEEIRAHYLSLFLREDQRTPKVVRARWNVVGDITNLDEAGGEIRARLRAQFLEIQPGEQDPNYRLVTLEGKADEQARLSITMPDGLSRSLVARKLEARVYGGHMQRLEGYGTPMTMVEFLDVKPAHNLRHVCADVIKAGFLPGGDLDQMFLQGQVEISDSLLHVGGGETALINVASGRMKIEGQAVELYSERGDIVAPEIEYSRSTGLIRAAGGVQANLEPTNAAVLAGTPLSEGDGPVHVEADEATWTERPPGFVFKGGVRAWRGQNLLLAEQMRGDEATSEMAASGGVRSVWIPERRGQPAPAGGETGAASVPIQVTAQTLSLRGAEDSLVYTGNVVVTQERRTIRCSELTVELDDGGSSAERMLCRGDVRLDDPAAGNRVAGQRAIYDVPGDSLEVFGAPVRLVDKDRNTFEGRYLQYDLASGQTSLRALAPGETAASIAPPGSATPGTADTGTADTGTADTEATRPEGGPAAAGGPTTGGGSGTR